MDSQAPYHVTPEKWGNVCDGSLTPIGKSTRVPPTNLSRFCTLTPAILVSYLGLYRPVGLERAKKSRRTQSGPEIAYVISKYIRDDIIRHCSVHPCLEWLSNIRLLPKPR